MFFIKILKKDNTIFKIQKKLAYLQKNKKKV